MLRQFDLFRIMNCVSSLWIKPTAALNSNVIGITTFTCSGSLSAHHQEFLAVHRLWYILCICDDRMLPGVGWNCSSILLLVAYGHHKCIICTKADVRLRTPDDGQKGCPKHVKVVVPITLEFSASVGFIHKESVTMHGHTIVKKMLVLCTQFFNWEWQGSIPDYGFLVSTC